ncbi:hypothetical protein AAFG07_20835 [Bradyrhizobium sp. B097]|uniref:hypothetical protein n=1 Tax=Bradyrhizobium sp. B097 TaxID=3140244 RepID=UPI003182FCCC
MVHHREIRQRDDGLFSVVIGADEAGPFPSYVFAIAIAEGRVPELKPAAKFRRYKIIREVPHLA